MHAQTLHKQCPIAVPGLILFYYCSKRLPLHTLQDSHPPATHLRVRGDERRLASAPERAVPSHGHIEHQLN